ncbi:MAG: tetratricopeptide repeat protein [Methylovirgula sp.]
MADFFSEVEQDYRRDQAIAIWKRYQNWIIGAAILVILGTAAWRINVYFRVKAEAAAGGRYEAALQLLHDGKTSEAIAAFNALGKDAPKGYTALARLVSADETAVKDPKAGIKAYDAFVADPVLNPRLRAVARLRAAYLRLDIDTPKQFERRYLAFAGPGEPYANSFRELLALAALKDGDEKSAGRWLDDIVIDPAAPDALRRRADAFLALVQAGKLPDKALPKK